MTRGKRMPLVIFVAKPVTSNRTAVLSKHSKDNLQAENPLQDKIHWLHKLHNSLLSWQLCAVTNRHLQKTDDWVTCAFCNVDKCHPKQHN
jgi:hypothetical protein